MANQTVNRPTKSLMARLVSCRVVLWALLTHGPRLAEILNGPLGRSLPEGIQANFEQHVIQLREVLSAARDLLISSDRNSRDQKAKTSRYRRVRDQAFKVLNPFVGGLKDTFRGACGDEAAEELGFASRTSFQPGELHEQAEHLTARLSEPDLELPTVRYRGVTLDASSLAEEMRPLVKDLGLALEDLGREERASEATKIARDEALIAYDRTFLWVARSAEALFKMANLPEVAKRVRPSTRRNGVTDEVESQDPDIPIGDPEEDTEDVTAEAPVPLLEARPDIPPAE